MKLSLITINKNNCAGLQLTLASVALQTFTDMEYIVVDGASTDGSADVINQYRGIISFSVTEPDTGVYNAMNKAIKRSNGDYLFFLNSGDLFYAPDTLQKVFEQVEDEDIVYGNLVYFFPDGTEKEVYMPEKITVEFMLENSLHHQASFYKRTLFERFGLYDESFRIASDWFFTLQLVAFHNISIKRLDLFISRFSYTGLSSTQITETDAERKRALRQLFSNDMLRLLFEHRRMSQYYYSLPARFIRKVKSLFHR